MFDIRTPTCPRCGAKPLLPLGPPQAWCSTEGCRVLTWDMRDSAATFEAKAQLVELGQQHRPNQP